MAGDTQQPAIAVPSIPASPYPLRAGNLVRPLIDGEPAFRRVCAAIEAARRSVWATVTFMWADVRMPEGRGSALDVLNRAAARGVDVRLVFWRPGPETAHLRTNAFWGSPEHIGQLEAAGSGIGIRWDRAALGFCQHQKIWLIDAGTADETAFLGGINLNPHSVVAPGHRGAAENHDVYVELRGPAAVDVHHTLVQRWNGATERDRPGGRWGPGSADDLPYPAAIPARRGDSSVQNQRTIHAEQSEGMGKVPGGDPFDWSAGEQTILSQYCAAIDAARRTIYLENQFIANDRILAGLGSALERGVEVVAVVPGAGEIGPELAALGRYERFTLAGLMGEEVDGTRHPVWVHSKLMVVDGAWCTVGSCNLHRFSLLGNCELNAACWDRALAGALLTELLHEHLGRDVTGLDDRAALRLFRRTAQRHRALMDAGDRSWPGLAFSLLPLRPDQGR